MKKKKDAIAQLHFCFQILLHLYYLTCNWDTAKHSILSIGIEVLFMSRKTHQHISYQLPQYFYEKRLRNATLTFLVKTNTHLRRSHPTNYCLSKSIKSFILSACVLSRQKFTVQQTKKRFFIALVFIFCLMLTLSALFNADEAVSY